MVREFEFSARKFTQLSTFERVNFRPTRRLAAICKILYLLVVSQGQSHRKAQNC